MIYQSIPYLLVGYGLIYHYSGPWWFRLGRAGHNQWLLAKSTICIDHVKMLKYDAIFMGVSSKVCREYHGGMQNWGYKIKKSRIH